MEITIQNLPYFCLMWTVLGFFIIFVGVLVLAGQWSGEQDYGHRVKQLFPALIEQEKEKQHKHEAINQQMYEKIIALNEEGLEPEEIAKQLKIGIGEVKLMISLYTVR